MSTKKKDKKSKCQPKRDKSGRFASKNGKSTNRIKNTNGKSKKPAYNDTQKCGHCKQNKSCHADGRMFCGMDFGEGDSTSTYWYTWEVTPHDDKIPCDPKGHCLNENLKLVDATKVSDVDPKIREIERLNLENKVLAEETNVLHARIAHYRSRKNTYKSLANLMRFLMVQKDKRLASERKMSNAKCLFTFMATMLGCALAKVAYYFYTLAN